MLFFFFPLFVLAWLDMCLLLFFPQNLDNWKCSRRKRVEHIIDRVVEVKKFELEEHERNRRKAKTFSEMMEERYVALWSKYSHFFLNNWLCIN